MHVAHDRNPRIRIPIALTAGRAVTYGVPLAFLGLFFVYPLGAILDRGLRGEGDPLLDVLADPLTREVVWFTVWQALASTALTLRSPHRRRTSSAAIAFAVGASSGAIVVVPFVLPTIVVALAFLAILPDGLEHGWAPILVAHAFFNVAVVVRIVGTFWANLDPRIGEAAATLGASPAARGREITLPLLAPALAAASAIVFLFSFTSFGIVLVLGGPRLRDDRGGDLQPGRTPLRPARCGGALARAARVRDRRGPGRDALERRLVVTGGRRGRARRRCAGCAPPAIGRSWRRAWAGSALFLGLPLAVLVERSLAVGGGHGFDAYRALGRADERPARLAVGGDRELDRLRDRGTAIAVVVGGLAAFAVAGSRGSRLLDGLVLLPLGASAVMLGLGFLIAFDTPPLDFRSAPWIVPVVQALVAIPFVVRIMVPALRSIDPRLREAAALLGASPGRVRREIDLPIVARGLAVAAGFAFAISLGEFGATVFLARPDRPTLPVAIFRFLGRPGELNVAQAYALAVVLMAVTVVSVLLVERIRVRRGGWF